MFPAACDSVHEELKQPWSINSIQGDKNWKLSEVDISVLF